MMDYGEGFSDQILEVKDTSNPKVDLLYPHFYVDKKLLSEEVEFLFSLSNKSALSDDNSLPLYLKEDGEIELLGRFLFYGINFVLVFKTLGVQVYYVEDEDTDPVEATSTESLTNFIRVSKNILESSEV